MFYAEHSFAGLTFFDFAAHFAAGCRCFVAGDTRRRWSVVDRASNHAYALPAVNFLL